MSPFSIAVDIGGTFTDCVVEDGARGLHLFKASSTPPDYEIGFVDALGVAADHFGLSVPELLGDTARIVHGSTVSTNALVERTVAPVGYLCSAGHPDVLVLREAVRKPVFDWRLDYPDPFVPRSRTIEIGGRISAGGVEIEPLHEDDVAAAVERLRGDGVGAIGVSYLWSVVDGRHERRTREIIHELWPEIPVTLGHELNPIAREYRRAIATVVDASLQPIVSRYVTSLVDRLAAHGYEGELLLANCVGGMMPPPELVRRPIYSVLSGPTLAPVAAKALTDAGDVIVADMGGTTFDVSAIRDGDVVVSVEAHVGGEMLGIPKVDVHSIGAGGGSIAWTDEGGLLRVGPHSAGASPGPACYGRGGTAPTVTDANVVLGILDPGNFLGGRMRLDVDAARRAVAGVAGELGCSLEEAAYSIYATSNNLMVGAIEDVTVNEGIDPRDCALVAGGGATGSHICDIAGELGIARALVPRLAAGLSAYGGLISDIRWEETATAYTDGPRFDCDAVNEVLERLSVRGAAFLRRARVPERSSRLEYSFLGRYRYQSWEIEVPFRPAGGRLAQGDAAGLVDGFHRMHERIYSIMLPDDVVEFTTWIVRAVGVTDRRARAAVRELGSGDTSPVAERDLYVRRHKGFVTTPVYDGGRLAIEMPVTGPALVEHPTTTILVTDGAVATLDAYGDVHLDLRHASRPV